MIREAIEEAKQTAQELPAFTAAVLMLVALCIGAHCAVFYEADGEQLKLTAADPMTTTATEGIDALGRMRRPGGVCDEDTRIYCDCRTAAVRDGAERSDCKRAVAV